MTIISNGVNKIAEKIRQLPTKPGVYQFKDARGEVLYVGKAKNLKARVKSYFLNSREFEPRLVVMKKNIADLDYTVVSSETESLMLENNLIKQYQPRFNVLMRDDKNYQFIKVDYTTDIPQIYTVRSIPPPREEGQGRLTPSQSPPHEGEKKRPAKYFGPYTSGLSVRRTLRLLTEIFHLCRNKKVTDKACFAYHLGRCNGACFGKIPLADYRMTFPHIEDFLKHRQTQVIKNLHAQMKQVAAAKRFETAANARDKIRSLEHLWQRQKIVSTKNANQDFLGLFAAPKKAVICAFLVREGKLIHTEYFELDHANAPASEILERFILQYYADASDIPRAIFLSAKINETRAIEKSLAKLRRATVKISVPIRGRSSGLIKLASENAALYHEREQASFEKNLPHVLDELQKILNLPQIPKRIEGFDISNIQGTNPVGSMVVFTDGRPDKSQYRKFKISLTVSAEGLPKADDFAMMREMLERRFKHSQPTSYNLQATSSVWPIPDLIIIDGGKGQLNVAVQVLQATSYKLPIIGLAKRLEEIFLPGQKNPILLALDNPVLFLLQRIRDEAHRFAITFYRSRHRQAQAYSRLEDIPGVGPVTRRLLLKKFGSVAGVRSAPLPALAREVGTAMAKKIKENL